MDRGAVFDPQGGQTCGGVVSPQRKREIQSRDSSFMRIAYIAPYQGPMLLERRPIVRNRSMSNGIKIELIANILQNSGNEVEIISQGEVIESSLRFYQSFSEPKPFNAQIPVFYASSLAVRRLNGFWSQAATLNILRQRHQYKPYDAVIVFNLKSPQLVCGKYALRQLGLPVILEYEDDWFVTVGGERNGGVLKRYRDRSCSNFLKIVSGCMAVSPHLLSQVPTTTPKMLIRGVVGDDVLKTREVLNGSRRNWVLFSGTHIRSNGVAELIHAWQRLNITDWRLHITGDGQLRDELKSMAGKVPGITFHGLVSRADLLRLMGLAKICINPHALSCTPGNVFAFKIIEYLAAGAHVITTPMGALEEGVEQGVTYIEDNDPATIANALRHVIKTGKWQRSAAAYVSDSYGTANVTKSLTKLIEKATSRKHHMKCDGARAMHSVSE
jgi:glycosyltransferase involved in cell wall biosynthesis